MENKKGKKEKKPLEDGNIIKNKDFYLYQNYEDIKRWNSYFIQVTSVLELKPKSVLEIGKGLGFVESYLKSKKINVKTLDINEKLKPDYVGDIRNMPFKKNQYDLVLCCEVLEHIPFSDFRSVLKEIYRITKKYCVLSLPYHALHFWLAFKLPGIKFKEVIIRIPFFKNKKTKYHYWEMGKLGYGIKKIRKIIKSCKFKILKEKNVPLNERHYFFILEK